MRDGARNASILTDFHFISKQSFSTYSKFGTVFITAKVRSIGNIMVARSKTVFSDFVRGKE